MCFNLNGVLGRPCFGGGFAGCECEEDYMACEWINFQGSVATFDSLSTSTIYVKDNEVSVSLYNTNVWPRLGEVLTPLGTFVCKNGRCTKKTPNNNLQTPTKHTSLELSSLTMEITTKLITNEKLKWEKSPITPTIPSDATSRLINQNNRSPATSLQHLTANMNGNMDFLEKTTSDFNTVSMPKFSPTKRYKGYVSSSAKPVQVGVKSLTEKETVTAIHISWQDSRTVDFSTRDNVVLSNEITTGKILGRFFHTSLPTQNISETFIAYTAESDIPKNKWKLTLIIYSCISAIIIIFLVLILLLGYIHFKKTNNVLHFQSAQKWEWDDL